MGLFEILCHAARHTLRPCVRPRRCSQRAPPSRVTPPATHSGLVCGRAGVCSFPGTRHHPLSPPCLCVLGGSMLCASAAPDVPGLIINATLYMSIHGRKPELPGQPGILYRGERASRVGGAAARAARTAAQQAARALKLSIAAFPFSECLWSHVPLSAHAPRSGDRSLGRSCSGGHSGAAVRC